MAFSEIEEILGSPLPDSARLYRPFWANQGQGGAHLASLAWQMAGWKTSQVDMAGETLVFIPDQSLSRSATGEDDKRPKWTSILRKRT